MVEGTTSIEATDTGADGRGAEGRLGRCERITPELCVAYMKALAADQDRWQRHIQQIRRQPRLSREEALRSLTVRGGTPLTWYTRKTTSASEPRAARRRPPLTASVPEWRPVRPGELQAAIPSPPQTLMTRGFTSAKRVSGLPLLAGAAPSPAAHALELAKIALACQNRHADGDDQGGKRPSQPVHP